MPKVSVIVPIYKVEKYLVQCLDSIVNQTLKDIEIILVDEGDMDECRKIIDHYEQTDSRVKTIHEKNGGYGASVNKGFDIATGEYIQIVESDDFIELNMCERLYNLAKQHDLDLVRCQYFQYNTKENSNVIFDNTWVPQNTIYCPLDNNIPFMQAPAIWCNLFKNELIKSNNIRFLETAGGSYQDTSFAFKLYACSKRFMMIPEPLLHYRVDNENSSVKSSGKADCVITEYKEIVRFAKEKNVYDRLRKLIPKIKYACYRWNHERLSKELKFSFLLKMSKEYLIDFLLGNIDKSMFTKREFKRIFIIAFFPIFYVNRSSL